MVNNFCRKDDFKRSETLSDGRLLVRINETEEPRENDSDPVVLDFREDIVENTAEAVRTMLKQAVMDYDSSSAVNGFIINHNGTTLTYWLPAAKRGQLRTGAEAVKEQGGTSYTLDLREYGLSLDVPCDTLISMLSKLEQYAVESYNVTSKHLIALDGIETAEGLLEYDYRDGYPERLEFEI